MKAISLFSGGLDSQLAACLIKQQGITVIGVNFVTPFFGTRQATLDAAKDLDIELLSVDISHEYMSEVLKNPVYGYGQHMNPCIDCHAYMLKKARSIMDDRGASFLVTGEVLGQRPMSQNKSALAAVEKLSGQKGLIVRPLSAKLLEPTIPEIEGWLDREKLLDISGRSRKRQMELAEYFHIKEYPSPAGGCLLTEANYSRRLRHLLKIKEDAAAEELHILSWGRHFNIEDNLLIIGRNQRENAHIVRAALPGDLLMEAINYPGPVALLRPTGEKEPDLNYIGSIVARYGDGKNQPSVTIKVSSPDGNIKETFQVRPMAAEEVPATL